MITLPAVFVHLTCNWFALSPLNGPVVCFVVVSSRVVLCCGLVVVVVVPFRVVFCHVVTAHTVVPFVDSCVRGICVCVSS